MSSLIKSFDRATLRAAFNNIAWNPSGKVVQVTGELVEALLPGAKQGMVVTINIPGHEDLLAEVVGFNQDRVKLIPFSYVNGISPGAAVRAQQMLDRIPVGDFLLGRVVDPMINGLDGPLAVPSHPHTTPLERVAPNPLTRGRVHRPLSMGIRALDGLLTFGEGQRVGVMAGSGVGKSVLMGMLARSSDAEVNVIGLIGERGREVREFIERDLGPEGLRRSVVVCSTSDQSPLMRLRAAKAVTAIAESFSAQGKRVLLMMDSLTRVAMAQREIGLAAGEPPTTKGYPPSVYSLLPRLLERCGPQKEGHGSITGIYTVLVEGDDYNDPIPDQVRSIVDGHINLTRLLAAKGHFPAIDIPSSVSRVMHDIVDEEQRELAQTIRMLIGVYNENIDLINIEQYKKGSNATIDAAIDLMPAIDRFLRQGINESSNLEEAIAGMRNIFKGYAPSQPSSAK